MVIAGLTSAIGAAGCSLTKEDDTGSSPDEVTAAGNTSALLKSTLVLQGGCTAAKVGPKHLLVAARCVTGNSAFAVGKVLKFASASSPDAVPAAPPADQPDNADPDPNAESGDDGAGASDAGASDASPSDAGNAASDAGSATTRDVTIADIQIHSSFKATCKDDVCGYGKIGASDAADIAVIILKDELATVPSIPVDLDPVGQADPLLVVNSGCSTPDSRATIAPRTTKSIAVPAKSVNHQGSPYATQPALVTRLASSYIVTPGSGWHTNDPRLCKTDMGSPVFRGGSAAVAGVTANYTTYMGSKLAVTTHHTRVDAMSRFKIGDWLGTLGVLTTHSCSETAGGCAKHSYDGGAPTAPAAGDGTTSAGDGGSGDAMAPDGGGITTDSDAGDGTDPGSDQPHGDQLPTDPGEGSDPGADEGDDYADAAAPVKKKSASKGGCSAAPGSPAPTGEMFLGLGLVLGAAIIRRRRAAR